MVTSGAGSPALSGALAFSADPSVPAQTTITTDTANTIGLSYQSSASGFTGTLHIGDVLVTVPASASVGQTYTVNVHGTSAVLNSNTVPLSAGVDTTLTVDSGYLVGDVFPHTTDSTGSFGDGSINSLDLIETLRAAVQIPGFLPPKCSDRFDAMDAAPADTANTRGGDGLINTLDLLAVLRRAVNTDTTRPMRASRLACNPTVAPEARLPLPGKPEGLLVLGAAESSGGQPRIPVYLEATVDLSLAGLSLGLGCDSCQLRYAAPDSQAPTIVDNELPGTLAVAWLTGWEAKAGNRVLLGYIETTAAAPESLKFFGISGNAIGSGRAVRLAILRNQ